MVEKRLQAYLIVEGSSNLTLGKTIGAVDFHSFATCPRMSKYDQAESMSSTHLPSLKMFFLPAAPAFTVKEAV